MNVNERDYFFLYWDECRADRANAKCKHNRANERRTPGRRSIERKSAEFITFRNWCGVGTHRTRPRLQIIRKDLMRTAKLKTAPTNVSITLDM